ncbi:MAG TPA: aquaporin [Candidatus Dojkabacteria bacterium]|jgi:aquaporin Z
MSLNKEKIAEYLSEYLGSFLFVSIIFLSGILVRGFEPFLIGFGLAALIFVFSKYGKAHLNPIVTISFLLTKKISLLDGITYLVLQFIAVATAYPLVSWIRDQAINLQIGNAGTAGTDSLREQLLAQVPLFNSFETGFTSFAFVVEGFLAFIFVLTILITVHNKVTKNSAAVAIGLILFIITAMAGSVTGASFHPFRSLIPALIDGGDALSQVWVYLAAPTVGAIVAALVYYVFEWAEKGGMFKLGGEAKKQAVKSASKSSTKK